MVRGLAAVEEAAAVVERSRERTGTAEAPTVQWKEAIALTREYEIKMEAFLSGRGQPTKSGTEPVPKVKQPPVEQKRFAAENWALRRRLAVVERSVADLLEERNKRADFEDDVSFPYPLFFVSTVELSTNCRRLC